MWISVFTRYQVKCCFFPDTEFICLSCFRQCLGNAVWGSDQGFGIQVTYFYQELYNNILSERQTQQSNNLFGRISKTSFQIFFRVSVKFIFLVNRCYMYNLYSFWKILKKGSDIHMQLYRRNNWYDVIHVHMI